LNTVAVLDPEDLRVKATITVPWAVHLDGIAVDPVANRVWLTDEVLGAVFVLKGACVTGVGVCSN
jgi:DNA-binding beta-propeller fold protein YncE